MTLIPWVIPIRVVDLLEIGLVAYILYKLYQLMRGTIAVQIFAGILALYIIQLMVTAADMTILRALFGSISEVFVLAVIILFQPEIRRLLLLLGQNPLVRRFMRSPAQQERIGEIVSAIEDLSKRRIGALIVFERSTGLRSYIETGAQLHAQVSRDLLVTIFYSQNPLHDGAVIMRDARIEAARCILPISTNMKLATNLGLRHRAAVGITEVSDAFVIVVSEETGQISTASNGELKANISIALLDNYIVEALAPSFEPEPEPSVVTA
ncbi:MAG: diadenylate cyclase CdaA [Bacteroidetes bacterium]|nr:diadenylate cyclase CdaA [Bacteroidota bacterium]